ncbi:dihydropteroate synthase [Trichococcus alkaliphilus]|uniref:dihydropteroate synthase n=1 Tax=Trichococcus alkaliphilus TaxID=2052943 RepID=UPI001EFEC8F8|nr:dihydropteroate synthase [Trichococcus alkaliphilus]
MKLTTKTKIYDLSQRSYIMGILNVTPDSFSDGGEWNTVEKAVVHAIEMVADGADIIDIGGESTRPGHTQISDEEEIARVVPIIEALKKAVDVPLSIDTYKSAVARAACEAGIDIINDIWGCKYDPEIAVVAAAFDVPIILMHNREKPDYAFLIEDMLADLTESVRIAVSAGVKRENIILDPGCGFGKTYEDNLNVVHHLKRFVDLGYPVLLGTSRKRFIGTALGDLPFKERDLGTAATTALGIVNGAQLFRVHNVKANAEMARMMDIMLKKGESPIG